MFNKLNGVIGPVAVDGCEAWVSGRCGP